MVFNWGKRGYLLERAEAEVKRAKTALSNAKNQNDVKKSINYTLKAFNLFATAVLELKGYYIEGLEKEENFESIRVFSINPKLHEHYSNLKKIANQRLTFYSDSIIIHGADDYRIKTSGLEEPMEEILNEIKMLKPVF